MLLISYYPFLILEGLAKSWAGNCMLSFAMFVLPTLQPSSVLVLKKASCRGLSLSSLRLIVVC